MGCGTEEAPDKRALLLLVLVGELLFSSYSLPLVWGSRKPDRKGEMTNGRQGPRPQFSVFLNKNKEALDVLLLCIVLPRQIAQTQFLLGLEKFLPFFPLPCHISFI